MSKLSKREKILIYVMVWVLVLAGGVYFLVIPAMESHDKAVSEYTMLTAESKAMKSTIKNKSMVEVEIDESQIQIDKMKKYFYVYLPNEDIDRLITGIVLKSGLKPYDLQIGATEAAQGDTTGGTAALNEGDQKTTQAEGEQPDGAKAATQGEADSVRTSVVSIRAKGSFTQLTQFLAEARREKGVRVASFEFTKNSTRSEAIDNVLEGLSKTMSGEYELNAVIEIYQINKY